MFLHRLCRIHKLEFTDQFLSDFAECMEFTEDSLSLNFFKHYFLPKETYFLPVFVKVLQYFHDYQLKKLSITHLSVHSLITGEIMRLINSKSSFLISFEVSNLLIENNSSMDASFRVHLPNLERVVVYRWEKFQPLKELDTGKHNYLV